MDYVIGSVAALVSGNVTPNRPKLMRRALTPIKHQPSPNVTPKSEFVDDRSIFLSPTLQKKKAIVKKSPKRIFQNPDLDVTSENENDSKPSSPVADKVKKHLNEDLEIHSGNKNKNIKKSPKKTLKSSFEVSSPRTTPELDSPQSANENTPKKQKKRKFSEEVNQPGEEILKDPSKSSKKNKKQSETEKSVSKESEHSNEGTPRKNKNKIKKTLNDNENMEDKINVETEKVKSPKKKNKNKKNKLKNQNKLTQIKNQDEEDVEAPITPTIAKKSKKKNIVNPNAITDKDSDSEHESDNDIVSENEEANKEILDTGSAADSSDEEEVTKEPKKVESEKKTGRSEDEIQRTIFVGNVPFSKKCKKEIKKIFGKHGEIETIRIRTVPVKDARVTPKLAVIRNELHPERTTVNVYVKFRSPSSVEQALSENNTVLNDCHLRVSRIEHAEHDPNCAVFVGNVPFAIEDEAFRAKFEKCGEIESVRIVRDKKTNAGKGFAYVNFKSKDGVELALALADEDLTIKNRIMRVKRCSQVTQKSKNQGRNVQSHQFGRRGGNFGQRQQDREDGAVRRLMHKRKNQDGNDGPPNKRQKNIYQPQKEKKSRKEFVGMTAAKKKKHTFKKGQKKQKALSEILTK